MGQTQTSFGVGKGKLKGSAAIPDSYRKIVYFSQRKGRVVGGSQ
jgi:hypothetical protein